MNQDKEIFSLNKRVKSFGHAWRGICIFIKTQKNSWIQLFASFIVIIAGLYFNLSSYEWIALVIAIGAVFMAEAFNTAIEIDMDLTSPDYHPRARDTKDVAAGAVLIASLTALIIGLIIFLPKIISLI
ncbi:MAG: hypothetical protein US50_C0002G0020 [Candidatus Nomurabacteria bacterium GW2011_GWB1_37_5]|uniref:Diacylglycerol kinase n=1 Tax=Candidatus Nomurabacteria bacterium GW2011_GWB1_37_5 TaxID=1618742 RepID=A0A0G0HBN0_9BACT|nr:MAG: hypothetical protein US50_C0002G0020 [Candidatus Nomurabacteria bacterium GW2011_GWB1_37_5]